jgi:hypothetical protein
MPKDFERRLRAAETASAEANTCEVWIELRNGMMRGPRAEDAPPSAAGVGPGENGGGPWVRADRAPKPFFSARRAHNTKIAGASRFALINFLRYGKNIPGPPGPQRPSIT